MRTRLCICILLVLLVIAGCTDQAAKIEPVVIAYVFPGDRVLQPDEIAAEKLTHINYAFANIDSGRVVQGFSHDIENFAVLNSLKTRNPLLKVLISVGGWTWSGGFSDAALNSVNRKKFVESAVRFMLDNDLDGVDLDWEFPNLIGYGNTYRPEDVPNFTELLRLCRECLDVAGKERNRHFLLTIAAGAFNEYVQNTQMDKLHEYVDFINLMTYDMYESECDSITGHHAPLFTNPRDPKELSIDSIVKTYLDLGVPKHKIVLGMPFYGRTWQNAGPEFNGLYVPGEKCKKRIRTSHVYLKPHLENKQGFTRHWDPVSRAPFLYNEKEKIFVSYDDSTSIAEKCEYIKQKALRGAMFWEYSCDYEQLLLNTIVKGLK